MANPPGPGVSKPAAPSTKPQALPGAMPAKTLSGSEPNRRVRGEEDRRRSQRVLLRVKAFVFVIRDGQEVRLEVTTLSVNAHGALVAAKQGVPLETKVVLEHGGTGERVTCRVVRPPREMPEGFHTALEFTSPAVDFWKIAFPPTDWSPTDS